MTWKQRMTTLGLAALVLPLAVASGQEEPDDPTYLRAKGHVTYRIYCASCHGQGALGDGPVAQYLKVPPADLTRISERNGGEFPAEKVHSFIDGRTEVKTHGNRDMPIWGDAFVQTLKPTWKEVSDEERAQLKITEVVAYLESIQRPSGD